MRFLHIDDIARAFLCIINVLTLKLNLVRKGKIACVTRTAQLQTTLHLKWVLNQFRHA